MTMVVVRSNDGLYIYIGHDSYILRVPNDKNDNENRAEIDTCVQLRLKYFVKIIIIIKIQNLRHKLTTWRIRVFFFNFIQL